MSRIEHKYCLISISYVLGLFGIFILLHIRQNCVCFGDAYHKEFESHQHSILDISEMFWWIVAIIVSNAPNNDYHILILQKQKTMKLRFAADGRRTSKRIGTVMAVFNILAEDRHSFEYQYTLALYNGKYILKSS